MNDSKPDVVGALKIAAEFGNTDGAHHKQWVIDQMVRSLTGSPLVTRVAHDYKGRPYEYEGLGESPDYVAWVANYEAGEDGPETYTWGTGIAP